MVRNFAKQQLNIEVEIRTVIKWSWVFSKRKWKECETKQNKNERMGGYKWKVPMTWDKRMKKTVKWI